MTKHRSASPIIAAILLLVPVLYVVSYLAMVVPKGFLVSSMNGNARMFAVRQYRCYETLAAKFFYPLEQIDRKLRPDVWRQFRSIYDQPVHE